MPGTSLQVFQTGFLFRHEELFSEDLAGPGPSCRPRRRIARSGRRSSSIRPLPCHTSIADHAISEGDTTGAARLLGTFARLAPESPFVPWYGLMMKIAFGDPAARYAAEAALDTLETADLLRLGLMLGAPRCCWRLSERVLRKTRGRGELQPDATTALFWVSLARGRPARHSDGWTIRSYRRSSRSDAPAARRAQCSGPSCAA